MAPAPNGGLYVATSPDGKIYQVDRSGVATTFFDPEDRYIWALTVDARGNVYAGTGDKGIVYKITPDGKGTAFYRTKSTHATALAMDRAGNLLVGTESPGSVIRVDADGKGFVLLDTPYQEIRGLRFDDKGQLYASQRSTAVDRRRRPRPEHRAGSTPLRQAARRCRRCQSPPKSPRLPSWTGQVLPARAAARAATTGARRKAPSTASSPDGLWDQLWDSREDVPYDVVFDRTGARSSAPGNKGKLYRLEGDPLRPTLLTRASAQQVTAFYTDPRGRLYLRDRQPGKAVPAVGRARGARHLRVRAARRADGGDLGHDQLARHGRQRQQDRALRHAAGNTETPDDTWSAWSHHTPSRPTARRSPVPKARYLQWRAVLTGSGDGPVLTSVTAAYLQRNLRPQVRSITVHPPGIVFQKPFTTGEPDLAGFDDQTTPDRKLTPAAQSTPGGSSSPVARPPHVSEGAADARLESRRRERRRPRLRRAVPPRRRNGLEGAAARPRRTDSRLGHDDGAQRHLLRARSSPRTAPSNPPAAALAGELDSTAFEIDNTPPTIMVGSTRTERGRTTLVFDVKDDHSPVQRVEFSQDGGSDGRRCFRTTGSRTRRSSTTSWRSTASSATRPHASRDGFDEQRRRPRTSTAPP